MKELILKANAFLTAILLMVVPLCLACAIEGNSPCRTGSGTPALHFWRKRLCGCASESAASYTIFSPFLP